MKKTILCVVFICAVCGFWAVDIARFSDMGFSPDGSQYLFAQYGEAAQSGDSPKGYAELYTVDTAKNEYVRGSTLKSGPSYKTSGKSGEIVFDELVTSGDSVISRYNLPAVSNSVLLYQVAQVGAKGISSAEYKPYVEFRDFDNPLDNGVASYSVRVNEFVDSNDNGVYSSFCLLVELRSASGNVLRRIVAGNPKTRRAGVSGYRLNRVLRDASGHNMVFVIEKQVVEPEGMSIRYMVETLTL